MEGVRLLGEFLGNASLWMRREQHKNAQVYLLATGRNGGMDRIMAAIVPLDSEAVVLDELTILLPAEALEMEWSAQAIQLSKNRPPIEQNSPVVMKGKQLTLKIDRKITEPFLLLMAGEEL